MAEAPPAAAPSAPPATPAAPEAGAPPPPAAATEPQKPVTQDDAFAQIEATEDYAALEAQLDQANAPKAEEPAAEAPAVAPTPAPAAAPATMDGSQPLAAPVAAVPDGPGSDENEMVDDAATGEKLPKNFRFHTEDPARARYLQLLRREPGANPIDLALRAGYTLPATASAPAAAAVAPTEPAADPLKPLRDEIAALQEKRKAHRAAYEFDQADEVSEQIMDKRLDLDRKERELESEANYEAEYRADYDAAKTQAVEKYPETNVKGTQQFEEVARERAYLEQAEPGFFDDPNYPIRLIERLEKRRPDLFKSGTPAPAAAPAAAAAAPATPPAPPAVTPPPSAAARLPARPLGSVEPGTTTTAPPLTRQAAEQAIENITDPDELERLANAVGTPVGPKKRR